VTAPLVRYSNFMSDNDRWNDLELRDGDIVVATPAKCGTTWMQSICALLVFGGPDLPAGIDELSPWVDLYTKSRKALVAQLDAQTHRRFMKTHTPLDGLPFDPRVTYICVGRDPRDVAVSMAHHRLNMDRHRLRELQKAAGVAVDGQTDPADLEAAARKAVDDLASWLRDWTDDPTPATEGVENLTTLLHHFTTFWDRRDRPNVALFHFGDYLADLPAELCRLADVLGYDLSPERAEDLATEAGIDRMRQRAEILAPVGPQGLWKDPRRFFRSGGSGEWQAVMTEDDGERYQARVAELVPPDLGSWAHRGWGPWVVRLEGAPDGSHLVLSVWVEVKSY
jgi:hypothetical protein